MLPGYNLTLSTNYTLDFAAVAGAGEDPAALSPDDGGAEPQPDAEGVTVRSGEGAVEEAAEQAAAAGMPGNGLGDTRTAELATLAENADLR